MHQEENLLTIPIKGEVPYVIARAMCPKNEWGRKVIQVVNQFLLTERKYPPIFL